MIKRLARCVREYKKDSILTPVFVAVEVLLEVLIPFTMASLIDKGIDRGDMNYILKLGVLLAVMAMLSLLFGALSGRAAARASAGFAKNLRHDMYHHVQDFSFSNIDKYSTAGIVTRLTTDVSNLQQAYQMIIRIAVRCPLMLAFSLLMTVRISPRLSLIFLCVIPVLGVGLYVIIRHAHPIFERVFKTYDKLNAVVQENLLGIRVVKSFVREEHEKEKFGAVSQSIYSDFSRAEKTLAFNMPLMQFCVYACMLLISWFGARMVVGAEITTGELTSLFNYTMQILMSLMMLSMVLVMITMARASAERIGELLDERSDLQNCDSPVMSVPDGSVRFDHVSFSYKGDGGKLCLRDVDLDIKSGETVGILGGTGTSKTTLVQLIPRLYDATQGSVMVGGVNVRDYDLETLRNEVAMVLQKNTLFSGTIKENLRWGNESASDEELVRVCRLAQADGFVRELPNGYDTYIEQGGTNVSGGQKQRLCIARALLKKPKILILDDSTSAVDTRTDALIRKAFREEIPDTTKFIIAQRVSSVQDADHIIVMEGGRVAAFGSHEELLKNNAIYREVYESQTRGGDEDGKTA
ncbi:ABC transporter ATP-binding protein [Feifania hominis]|uniref:ABC transporter ATP-binding protein n=1 Tax=Feifania hominis TaxID=2763660 RepID=A0A926DEA7_9FIRM|nr:ABC transporter ATP-binding protein [Feifania hominis]MBC8536262.1 ABC transporter ATP-binding protein [Feifania hominis]